MHHIFKHMCPHLTSVQYSINIFFWVLIMGYHDPIGPPYLRFHSNYEFNIGPNLKIFKRKHHLTTRILITRVYFCQRGLVYKTSFLLKIWLILIFLRKKKCNLVSFHEIPFSIWESETIQKRWQLLNSMNYFQNSERPMIPKFKPKKKKTVLAEWDTLK